MDTGEDGELAAEFAQLGQELHESDDHSSALQRLVDLSVKHIDGCDFASIVVIRRERILTLASSDVTATRAEELQAELREGPCVTAARDDHRHLMFDVEDETPWPRYAAALHEQTVIRSVLALPLVADESGALNLFSITRGGFGSDSVNEASIFAAHASNLVALHTAEDRAANLEVALSSSRDIGTAIGILMAYRRVTQDEAFAMLKTASQSLHRKIRDVADDVVQTGTLPER